MTSMEDTHLAKTLPQRTLFHFLQRLPVGGRVHGRSSRRQKRRPRLKAADRLIGLTQAATRPMGDDRRRKSVAHPILAILGQRVNAPVLGHNDLDYPVGGRMGGY